MRGISLAHFLRKCATKDYEQKTEDMGRDPTGRWQSPEQRRDGIKLLKALSSEKEKEDPMEKGGQRHHVRKPSARKKPRKMPKPSEASTEREG